MAESRGVSGILGADTEASAEGSAPESPLDPTAAAFAAEAAKLDPELTQKVSAYFEKQSHLVEVQTEHLHEQRAVNLQLLKLRRVDERLRVGLRVFVIVVATFIGIAAALLIHDAVTSRSVVVESFDAPPALLARGVTGKVVAAGLLDELRRLQTATRADAAKRSLSNAWSHEIQLAVPDTGISLGEISRILRSRFGHDVHIDGELVQTQTGGLALTVRGDDIESSTFIGDADALGKLTTSAAEYVYARSEPVLWAYHLNNLGRYEESMAFSRAAFAAANPADRPYLLNTWANALMSTSTGSIPGALTLYRAALKLKPDYWIAHNNVMIALWAIGQEEEAWRAGLETQRAAGGRPGRAPEIYYANWDELMWNLGPWMDEVVVDAEANSGIGTGVGNAGLLIADIDVRLHDLAGADLAIQTIKPDPADPTIPAITHFVRGRLASEGGDSAHAAMEMEAFQTAYADPAVSSQFPGYACWIAPAEEAAGHPDRADAVLKSAGTYVDCFRFRADILDGRGDRARAQQAYAAAVALAPDLPAAYFSWGLTLAKHGDLDGAAAKFKDANQKGPHWADPLKAWGDVLAKQGHVKEALAKYDNALKYAPNWKQLKEARELVAKLK
jgi:tetratricopeptide (TPR) repeat protein